MNNNPKNPNFAKIKLSKRVSILLTVLVILIGSLSCNLPISIPGLGGSGKDPMAELEDLGLLNVSEISATEEEVVIEYEILLEEDPQLMVYGWLETFQAAGKTHSDVDKIILRVNYLGVPYLELTALNADVQAFIEEDITPDSFLDGLLVLDQRPPEMKLHDTITELGYQVSRVDLEGGTVVIEMNQDPVEDRAALFSIWWSIGAAVLEESVPADRIQIRSLMPDTSELIVEIKVSDLEAYLAEEITPLVFLARVEISEEPAVLVEE